MSIRQENNWSCVASVAAMATNSTVEDFIAFVGHDGSAIEPLSGHPDKRAGFMMQELAAYFIARGYFLGGYLQNTDETFYVKDGQPYFQCQYYIAGMPAMFTTHSKKLTGCRHVCYWDGQNVHDPAGDALPLHEYLLLEWWPVMKFDDGPKLRLQILPPIIEPKPFVPAMNRPIQYYTCPKCFGEFVASAEGYTGLCRNCKTT